MTEITIKKTCANFEHIDRVDPDLIRDAFLQFCKVDAVIQALNNIADEGDMPDTHAALIWVLREQSEQLRVLMESIQEWV